MRRLTRPRPIAALDTHKLESQVSKQLTQTSWKMTLPVVIQAVDNNDLTHDLIYGKYCMDRIGHRFAWAPLVPKRVCYNLHR